MIIFAHAGPEEAQIKAVLIAEEIRRQLFEHEDEDVRGIEVEETVAVVSAKDIKDKNNILDSMDVAFKKKEMLRKQQAAASAKPAPQKKKEAFDLNSISDDLRVDIDPYSDKQGVKKKKAAANEEPSLDSVYLPIWNVKRNIITTYLCLVQDKLEKDDPFDSYELFFLGAKASQKASIDMKILKNVAKDLKGMKDSETPLFLMCPVHYTTLTNTSIFNERCVDV